MPDLSDAINILRNRTDSNASAETPDAEITAIWEAIVLLTDAIGCPTDVILPILD